MLTFRNFTKHFGTSLFDLDFQSFLSETFSDLTEYNILESDYLISKINGIQLGFTNNEAIYDDDESLIFEKGNPIFTHFILFPKSLTLINSLPFDISFEDKRAEITIKAGIPIQTKEGYADFLNKNFLVDNYIINDIVITFDYDTEKQTLNFIQIRDNNLVGHLNI